MTTLLEAASCGTPSITTKGTSMEEFAQNNKNALLVNPSDEVDLCEKIYMLMTDKELYEEIAKNAFVTVRQDYSWLKKAEELIKLYSEV